MNDSPTFRKRSLTLSEIRNIMKPNQMKETNEQQLATINPSELMKISNDVAAVCREIVKKTALQIKGRQYVRVEGWQAIATAHGCIAGSRDVEKVENGWRAIGELRRASDGALLAVAEGWVGTDEVVWVGGQDKGGRTHPPRFEYAIRAMAQTRAISRVCRSAFAHVVILIDADLSTTPAEEAEQPGEAETTAAPGQSSSPKKPVKYDDADLVNLEAGQRTHASGPP
jgi:hypothetical protein